MEGHSSDSHRSYQCASLPGLVSVPQPGTWAPPSLSPSLVITQRVFGVCHSGHRSLCCLTGQGAWHLPGALEEFGKREAGCLCGGGGVWWGRVAGPGAQPGISGPPTAAEYSAPAILSSRMTGIFALARKVRASSLCLLSVPSWPDHFPGLGSFLGAQRGPERLQGQLAAHPPIGWVSGV